MSLCVEISQECDSWAAIRDIEPLTERILAVAAGLSGVELMSGVEVSVLLCDDAAISALNRDWRHIDKATNVLSFPAPGQPAQRRMLGDIALAYETTAREALDEGKSLPHHYSHLVVHGFLHLVGFDHELSADAEIMETAERQILEKLGIADPYAGMALLGARAAL